VPAPTTLDFQDISPLLFEQKPLNRPLFWHQPHYMNQGGKPAGVAREGEITRARPGRLVRMGAR
jgi:hypothetical protein